MRSPRRNWSWCHGTRSNNSDVYLLSGFAVAWEAANEEEVARLIGGEGVVAGGIDGMRRCGVARMEVFVSHFYHVLQLLLVLEN